MSTKKIKNALISVSDKTGIVDFAKELNSLGINIYSTGGTKLILEANDIPVQSVSEITGFPEIMDGRVKTLHPKIHGGLLADLDNEDHVKQAIEHGIESIDLLVVNLYPFEKTLQKENVTHSELIENIDIGGPTMLRSAAKNYKHTTVIITPKRYSEVLRYLSIENGEIPEEYRLELAGEVFANTAYYDSLISSYFFDKMNTSFPEITSIPLRKLQDLRYGENPHQSASLYGSFDTIFKKLHGKDLSFNNIIDINGASGLILDFVDEKPAVAIIKHTNPCGVGIGDTLEEAYRKAFATDTVSPFGGIIAFNKPVDLETAKAVDEIFTEVLIAPKFSNDAYDLLTKKKNRRLLEVNYAQMKKHIKLDFRSVVGGYLVQEPDTKLYEEANLQVVTKRKPTDEEMKSLLFGWKICKYVKSNTIVYNKHDRTLGIGAGQMSRVDSSRIASEKAKLMGLDLNGSTLASDAFFPFADGLLEAANAGVTAVIQPGGSVRDQEVIDAADEKGIAMVFTGMRHFRH